MSRPFDICGPLPTGVTVLEASAGTGKTFTIAALAARYVAEGTPLDRVLLVTFTRMATGELRERVWERLVSAEEGLAQALAGVPPTEDLVAAVGLLTGQRALEPVLGADQALADAIAQLAGRHARERHEQQVLQAHPVGDVAGGERGDRERLAGARAGLEHGDAAGQRAADVERAALCGRAHRSSSRSQASSPSHRRIA